MLINPDQVVIKTDEAEEEAEEEVEDDEPNEDEFEDDDYLQACTFAYAPFYASLSRFSILMGNSSFTGIKQS